MPFIGSGILKFILYVISRWRSQFIARVISVVHHQLRRRYSSAVNAALCWRSEAALLKCGGDTNYAHRKALRFNARIIIYAGVRKKKMAESIMINVAPCLIGIRDGRR